MKRILVVNVNWLGDVVFSTPVFYALRQAYPQAHIACLAVPRVQEVLLHCPVINERILYDERGTHRSLWAKRAFIDHVKSKKFDIVFHLHRSWTRSLLMMMAGIPERVGYNAKKQGNLLTHHVMNVNEDHIHRRDIYLKVIESYGIDVQDRHYHLEPQEHIVHGVEKILQENNIQDNSFIVINTGGNWDLKQWSPARWSAVLKKLVNEMTLSVVLVGADKDEARVQQIISEAGVDAVNLCGKTDLSQLIALLSKARVMISGDSGPLHVASAVGCDVIALFGPTRPENTGLCGTGKALILQNDVGCNKQACYYLECPDNICMKTIEVDDVCRAVQSIIS